MSVRGIQRAILAVLVLASSVPARAAVIEVSDSGFTVREIAHVSVPASKVYAELLHPEHWWSPDHTFSQNAANLSLDARAGGCFCERLPGGGSVQHLTVVAVRPGHGLTLRGALGPFQSQGVDGALSWQLTEQGGGTDVTLTYNMGGHLTLPGGFMDWSSRADAMLGAQLARLGRLVQNGSPGT